MNIRNNDQRSKMMNIDKTLYNGRPTDNDNKRSQLP